MTEITVPRAARLAEADAFEAFYAETVDRLGGYAFQLVGDAELAAEVVQEAYTRLLARWIRVRQPRPYLFRIATNLAKDAWESRDRTALVVRSLGETAAAVVPPPDAGLWDAVGRLPRRHRVVVLLFYYADLPLVDVAAAVHRPPGTVKRLLAEARERLAEALGGVS